MTIPLLALLTVLALAAGCDRATAPAPLQRGLAELPLLSQTGSSIDQSVLWFQAPLPLMCRWRGRETVEFCLSPFSLSMPIERYDALRALWGARTTPQSRVRALVQLSELEWQLVLERGSEKPMAWLDPEHHGSLRLWPVSPSIAQVKGFSGPYPPEVIKEGESLLRIQLPIEPLGHGRRFSFAWDTPLTAHIRFERARKPFRVLLDPGHGGDEAGTTLASESEAALNLRAALALKLALEKLKVRVDLSRDSNATVPLRERFDRIASGGYDLAISLHHDEVTNAEPGIRTACYYGRFDLLPLASSLCQALERFGSERLLSARRFFLLTQVVNTPTLLLELMNLKDPRSAAQVANTQSHEAFLQGWSKATAQVIVKNIESAQ